MYCLSKPFDSNGWLHKRMKWTLRTFCGGRNYVTYEMELTITDSITDIF